MFRYTVLFYLLFTISHCQDVIIPSELGDPTDNSTTTVLPTTEKPAPKPTEPPTTDAPTTDPPTTDAPTTDAPTTTTEAPTEPPTEPPTEIPTTEPPVTTTQAPPTPKLKPGNWTVHDYKQNVTCILAVMALEFKIPYEKNDGSNATAVLIVPPTANVTGTCGEGNQTMALFFSVGEKETDSVSFLFSSTGSASKNFVISSIELSFYTDSVNFPNASSPGSRVFKDSDVNLFLTQVGKSYKCKSKIEVSMKNEQKVNATLVMEEAQIEAFRTGEDIKFGAPMLCSADEFTSDIVPIAVGCALAALVVIVIVAYLIGRRRARAKGYQSM